MEKNMVNWFEIPVLDMPRAKKFYTTVFGKELIDMIMPEMEMAAFPWVESGEFAAGSLVKAQGYEPTTAGTIVYFYSEDVDIELAKIEKNGGKIMMPKTSIGEHGFMSLVLDTEGNRIGLHSIK